MNQKKAITDLWHVGYFTSYRKNKEIENRLMTDFGMTSSNIAMILKNCGEFLRKTSKGWIQKGRPNIESEINIVYFEAGKPFTSRGNLLSILKKLKGEIKICDPYLTREALEVAKEIGGTAIKFLSSSGRNHLKISAQDIIDFKKEHKTFEFRLFPHDHLHDRYIIHKDGLIIIGQGLSAKNKEGFVINLPNSLAKDLIESLVAMFDRRWKEPSNEVY